MKSAGEIFLGNALVNPLEFYGKWECNHNYISLSSKESFALGDFIVVYQQQYVSPSGYSESFYYNSSNNGKGLIHYSELNTYWALVKDKKIT